MKNFEKWWFSDSDSKVWKNLYDHLEDIREDNDINTKEYENWDSNGLEEELDNDISTLTSQDLKDIELSVVWSSIKQPLNDLKKQINIHDLNNDSWIISMTPQLIRDSVVTGKNIASASINPHEAWVPLRLQKLAI